MKTELSEHIKQFNQSVAALIAMEGMKAENEQRKHRGESMAYVEEHFINLIDTYDLTCKALIIKTRNFIL